MNLKKLILSTLVLAPLCALFLSITQVTWAQTIKPLNQLYTNVLCGISINYPSNWVKEESNKKYTSGGSSLITLAEIKPNTTDGFKSIVELEANSISNFPDKSIEGIASFQKDYIQLGPGTTIEQSGRMDINGLPAYKIVYDQAVPKSNDIWKITETYLPSGDTEYTIRFTATDKDLYDKYIPIVEDMIQSVKLDGKKC